MGFVCLDIQHTYLCQFDWRHFARSSLQPFNSSLLASLALRMRYIVVADFSFIYHMVFWPAVKAVEKDPKYILEDVIRTNFDGKMRTIERDLREIQIEEYDLIFVEDRFPQHKVDLFPQYHHDRPDNSASKQSLKQYTQSNGFNCRFCYSNGNEADDAIATITAMTQSKEDLFAIVCTGDHDLWQLIGDRVAVFDLLTRKIVTKDDVLKQFGVLPHQIALVKSLWGDSSDNVPNVMPRQQKQMLPIVHKATDGTLESFFVHVDREWHTLSEKCQKLYYNNLQQVIINFELVRLRNDCELRWG